MPPHNIMPELRSELSIGKPYLGSSFGLWLEMDCIDRVKENKENKEIYRWKNFEPSEKVVM